MGGGLLVSAKLERTPSTLARVISKESKPPEVFPLGKPAKLKLAELDLCSAQCPSPGKPPQGSALSQPSALQAPAPILKAIEMRWRHLAQEGGGAPSLGGKLNLEGQTAKPVHWRIKNPSVVPRRAGLAQEHAGPPSGNCGPSGLAMVTRDLGSPGQWEAPSWGPARAMGWAQDFGSVRCTSTLGPTPLVWATAALP